jgi:NMT1/THI5 like
LSDVLEEDLIMKCIRFLCAAVVLSLALPALNQAEEPFSKTVGDVKVGDVKVTAKDAIDLPFLTWGGDVATFMANGDKETTKSGSPFDKLGLKFKMVNGDDFVAQVKNYLEGKTPFLRGTISQIGQASEVLGKDPRTKPVVFLQLTWSAGDHMVSRGVKTLNDLKGKTIALQEGGPHIGMLDDALNSAKLKWEDVKIVWKKDLTGKDGPAEAFRKDPKIDACFVITPDMLSLTTGLEKEGDGSEKTVKGAKVLVSTVYMSRSIADVYAVRKDFYDKNKDLVEKLAGAYFAMCEELIKLRKNYDLAADKRNKDLLTQYKPILKLCQDVFGKDAVPDEEAAHGLISDASFVGMPGNKVFFTDPKNTANFTARMKSALDVAVSRGYASARIDPLVHDMDYDKVTKYGELKITMVVTIPKPVSGEDPKGALSVIDNEANTIYFFTISYEAGVKTFDQEKYAKDFEKVVQDARIFGGASFAVRGHADVTLTLSQFVKAGIQSNQLRRIKNGDKIQYFVVKTGQELDLSDTKKVLEVIKTMDFAGAEDNPKATMEAAQKLSDERADGARDAIIQYAKTKGVILNPSQLKAVGVGVSEPVIAKPKDIDEAGKNRRVEFRALKVKQSPEDVAKKDFEY